MIGMITMAHAAFDTLKFVETLVAAGMSSVQAKALSEAQKEVFEEVVDHTLATKVDITTLRNELKIDIAELRNELKTDITGLRNELKADIAELRAETKAEITELRSEVKADIAALRAETKAEFAEVKTDIAKLQIEMRYMRWMLGIIIFGVGSLLVKAFF